MKMLINFGYVLHEARAPDMSTLIDLGDAFQITTGVYFCARREDGGVKKIGSDGLPRFTTAILAHAVEEPTAPIDAN